MLGGKQFAGPHLRPPENPLSAMGLRRAAMAAGPPQQQHHHHHQAAAPGVRPPRRQRKSNFSNGEVEILVREVAARRDVLFGQRGRAAANTVGCDKMSRWREIAAAVNAAGGGGSERRTVREVRKKWENVVSSFRRKLRQPTLLSSLIGSAGCPADEALACANAYCGMRPQPPIVTHPRHEEHHHQPQQQHHHQNQNHHEQHQHQPEHHQSDHHQQLELMLDNADSAPPLFLQPEVHIESDDSPLDFGCGDGSSDQPTEIRIKEEPQAVAEMVEFHPAPAPPLPEPADEDERAAQDADEKLDLNSIELQKLQVMRQLLHVETKRLKVEKKRLKVERMRLQIELHERAPHMTEMNSTEYQFQ